MFSIMIWRKWLTFKKKPKYAFKIVSNLDSTELQMFGAD